MLRSLLALLFCASPLSAGASNSLLDVSPDGKLLAVANTDNGTVSVVDLKSRKKLHEFNPSDTFFFNIHLDGMRASHDLE